MQPLLQSSEPLSPRVRKLHRDSSCPSQSDCNPRLTVSLVMSGFYNTTGESSQAYYASSGYSGARIQPEHPSEWNAASYQPSQVSSTQYANHTYSSPSQYVSWPVSDLPPMEPFPYSQSQYAPGAATLAPPDPYSTDPWPNAPWPSLHPDDYEVSSDSRSTSPHPTDLRDFGTMLSDGRTWKCAHPGCTSQARFTRGCDLRKHYRRHTKSHFCRHENCPTRDKGFSSNKDRVSHSRL